jgi:hypothetical protein
VVRSLICGETPVLKLTVSQGYKHYQHKRMVPAFPFGYASFEVPLVSPFGC